MERHGLYLYCFARGGSLGRLDTPAVDGREGVETLQVGEVAAVFSPVALDEFSGPSAATDLRDPQWIIPRACRHERVIAEMMRRCPVLPVRFGAVFSSADALSHVLRSRGEEISRGLDRVSDKEEWAVKGFLDLARAEAWLAASDPGLAQRRARMPEASGARYLLEKQFRADVQQGLKLWRHATAQRVQEVLEANAVDACALSLQPRDLSCRDGEMVLNFACLLRRGRANEFRARLDRLSAGFLEQGLTLEISGPWPAYHFCPAIVTESD